VGYGSLFEPKEVVLIKKVALSLALASSLTVGGMAQAQPGPGPEPGYGGFGGLWSAESVLLAGFVIGGIIVVADRVDNRKNPSSP
jgi:hypothetical protein